MNKEAVKIKLGKVVSGGVKVCGKCQEVFAVLTKNIKVGNEDTTPKKSCKGAFAA